MKLKLYFLFFILLSCYAQANQNRDPVVFGNEKLLQFYHKFKNDAESIGRTLPKKDIAIIFGRTKNEKFPNRVGYCVFSDFRLVVIEEEYFNNVNEETKELLMYHEFGHCILDLAHTTDCNDFISFFTCKSPRSIMYPTIGWTGYLLNKIWYLQELFSNKNYQPILEESNCSREGKLHGR